MRKVVLSAVGWALLVVGIALFPLPGPGLLVMFLGLVVLADQHEWARRRLDRVRARALLSAAQGVRTQLRAAWSIVLTSALAASGLVWIWPPAQPTWWALPSWTWLPGGSWSGVSQLLSGLLSLALVLWSYRRFHGRPDGVGDGDRRAPVGRV